MSLRKNSVKTSLLYRIVLNILKTAGSVLCYFSWLIVYYAFTVFTTQILKKQKGIQEENKKIEI
jgi:hypothetical protein